MIPAIQYSVPTEDQFQQTKDFFIEPTSTTPLIHYSTDANRLELKGKSSPENAPVFYQKVQEWFDYNGFKSVESLTVEMSLSYFNTSSCKCLFMIFKKLNEFRQGGMDIAVNWYYEEDDDDMLEAGEDFSEIFDMSFNLIEVEG